jgi:phage recombination protein Bet
VRQWNLDTTKVQLIKRTCCPKGTDDDQMALFFHECARRGVHPMDRMLIMTLFRDGGDGDDSGDTTNDDGKKPVFITTIDLFRSQSEDTGKDGGCDEPRYGPDMQVEITEYKGKGQGRTTSKRKITVPQWASVTVYKLSGPQGTVRVPVVGKVRWSEFYPGPSRGAMWHKMPYNQLAKCAEAQARRKAFPRKLGRLYVREEMEQALAGEDATPVGRGRTAKADAVETHDLAPDPIGVHNITDAEEISTPPEDRWIVLRVDAGTLKGKTTPIWKLTAENGLPQKQEFYTLDRSIAEQLQKWAGDKSVFTLVAHRDGSKSFLDEVAKIG